MRRRSMSRLPAMEALRVGDSAVFEAKPGEGSALQRMIGAEALRLGVQLEQQMFLGVSVKLPRQAIDIIRITRVRNKS